MKVGTLTLHRSQNYGGVLQAYALQQALLKMGVSSDIIDYWYPGSCEALYGATYASCKTTKSRLRFIADTTICSFGSLQKKKELRIQRTIDFIKRYLSENSYKNYNALKQCSEGYNAYISGSDQVWNPNFMASDEAYRLEFVPKERLKISYAASFGVSQLPSNKIMLFREALKRFDHISVREKDGVEIVKEVSGKHAELVLDPTLLLRHEDWLRVTPKNNDCDPYILCYFFGDNGATWNTVYRYQKESELPIYTIGYHPSRVFNRKVKTIVDAGPLQFLSLFKGASVVFTNSFHGTAFSILFRKPFYTFIDTSRDRKQISSRITTLIGTLGLQNRIAKTGQHIENVDVDYDCLETLLNNERIISVNFLQNALGI